MLSIVEYRTDFAPFEEGADERERLATRREVHPCTPDTFDLDDALTGVEIAKGILAEVGALEPSCVPTFNVGVWYSETDSYENPYTGILTERTFHLEGFSPEQEREIFDWVMEGM